LDDGNNKVRGVESSIPISAAISSYGLISMFPFMNIPNNPLLYMDTDGVVLSKPLDNMFIGKGLGEMKLEYEIKRAVYGSKKTYAVETLDGRLIKKAVGLNSNCFTFQDYINYLKGEPLSSKLTQFKVN
jgi:hypothetical protein